MATYDLLKHLKKEHREVMDILEQLEEGNGNREELFMKLKKELMPHMKAEEKCFYAALMGKEGAREDTLESFEEHHVTEGLFKEMEKLSLDDERWSAKLKVLKELISHHMKEEEGKLFKIAKKELDQEEFPAIMKKYEKQSEQIKERLS